MHILPYEMKRAHWRGTWHAIRRFRRRADEIKEPQLRHMTPARFDILYVAWRADWQVHEKRHELGMPPLERRIAMWELCRLLGLARPTISRTAHRLDELGLVRVIRDEEDARYAVVVLTELGERMLRLAVACIQQDRVGMRDCMVQYLSEGAFQRLADVEPIDLYDLDARACDLVERSRRYAQFFGCQAVPIYDARVVRYLRPHTVSMLTWPVRGPDPRSEIMRMNMILIEAARDPEGTRGHLEASPPLRRTREEETTRAQRTAPERAAPEVQLDPELGRQPGELEPERPPGELWRLEDLPADYFRAPRPPPKNW